MMKYSTFKSGQHTEGTEGVGLFDIASVVSVCREEVVKQPCDIPVFRMEEWRIGRWGVSAMKSYSYI